MPEKPPAPPDPDASAPTAGDYAAIVGKQAVQTEKVYEGIAKSMSVVGATKPLTPVFRGVARRTPIIGAVMSVGQDVGEVSSNIHDSKYAKAGIAAVAGVVEVVGNVIGFGVGDNAREVVRDIAIRAGGEELAINKSDFREAAETVGKTMAVYRAEAEQKEVDLNSTYAGMRHALFPGKLAPLEIRPVMKVEEVLGTATQNTPVPKLKI